MSYYLTPEASARRVAALAARLAASPTTAHLPPSLRVVVLAHRARGPAAALRAARTWTGAD